MEGRKGAQALLFGDKLGFLRQIGFSREDITQPICGVGMTNPGSFQKDAHAVRLRAKAGAAGVGLWAAARPVTPSLFVPCSAAGGPGQAKRHPGQRGRGFGAGMGQAWGLQMGLAAWGEPKAMLGLGRSSSRRAAVGDALPLWQEEN